MLKTIKNSLKNEIEIKGLARESNSEPLAPKARIIPLDQQAKKPQPGIEPESNAWKASIMTIRPSRQI